MWLMGEPRRRDTRPRPRIGVRSPPPGTARYGGFAVGLLVAIAVHAIFLTFLGAFIGGGGGQKHKHGVQLVRLSRSDWDKNRRIELKIKDARPAGDKDKKKDKKDDDVTPPGKVVSLPPPDKEERPDTADFASEWNQKVAHETRSRDQMQDAPAITRRLERGALGASELPRSKADTTSSAPTESEASGPKGAGRALTGDSGTDATDGRGVRMFALEIPKQAAREPLQLKMDIGGVLKNRSAIPEVPGNGDTARLAMGNRPADEAHRTGSGSVGDEAGQGLQGGGNGTHGLPSLADLTPSTTHLARLAGAPANDWLPEVEVDAETRLNAWRWKHATFFNRVADKIRREWQGGQVLSKNDPAGSVYGFEDRMTVVQVTLDRDGKVLDINVEEPSGAVVLDDEAVRAFKDAGPFQNPPSQLFEGNDRFTFLFGFNVSYNRTNFDLDWRPN